MYRRTVPLGLLVGLGVFTNVFVLNLSYDIPVKLYSMQIVIACLFLVVWDSQKYIDFFVFHKTITPITSYDFYLSKRWQRIGRIGLKICFLIAFVALAFYQAWDWHQQTQTTQVELIKQGVYSIKVFKKNNEVMPVIINDSLAWKDFILDKEGKGSINTNDTLFNKKYGRGYFYYEANKSKQIITFKLAPSDTTNLFIMKYKIIDNKTIQLQGKVRKDTLYYELVRNDKQYPLAEKQFHWISEANR